MPEPASFNDLPALAQHLRNELENKKFILLYACYEPREMMDENKEHFRRILNEFISRYPFNPKLFNKAGTEEEAI